MSKQTLGNTNHELTCEYEIPILATDLSKRDAIGSNMDGLDQPAAALFQLNAPTLVLLLLLSMRFVPDEHTQTNTIKEHAFAKLAATIGLNSRHTTGRSFSHTRTRC